MEYADRYVARLLMIHALELQLPLFHHRSKAYQIVKNEIDQLIEMNAEDVMSNYHDSTS